MAADLEELLALPPEERMKLAEALLASAAPAEIGALLRELARGLERTNHALELAIARLSAFDERLRRSRAEVREAVLLSGEAWPFPLQR
jgi:hypothetical protein